MEVRGVAVADLLIFAAVFFMLTISRLGSAGLAGKAAGTGGIATSGAGSG
jgi:hypothetical protein